MATINLRAIYTIAQKEFLDNIRNKWAILISVIFIILMIASSYVVGGQGDGDGAFGGMQATVVFSISFTSFLIPLIAIILGFSTIAGEAETGAISVVLSHPIRRVEVILGKFLGLGAVLSVTPLIGFGVSGIIISTVAGAEQVNSYLAFIGLAILLGLVYLSLILFISAICKSRTRAIAGGVLLFFWSMIYGIIVAGVFIATGGKYRELMTPGTTLTYPDWLWGTVVFSPTDTNQMAVMRVFNLQKVMGFQIEPPDWLSLEVLLLIHISCIIASLVLAYYFFKRRDI